MIYGAELQKFVTGHSRVILQVPVITTSTTSTPATMKDLEGVETSSVALEREADPTRPAMLRSIKLVRGARVAVMMVWLLSAVAMATVSYYHLTRGEYSAFQAQVRMPLPVLDRVP
jgi:hypothetical protein